MQDFTKSSIYVIQNQEEIYNAPRYWLERNNKDISLYKAYLKFINELCSHIISKCDNNDYYQPNIYIENLGNQEKNKLNQIKNTINIEPIISEVFNQFEKKSSNNSMNEIYDSLKQFFSNYLKKMK